MACEAQKSKYDALEAQLKALENVIAKTPKPEQNTLQSRLEALSKEAFAAQEAYEACVKANTPPPPPPVVAPAQILEIVNPTPTDLVARAQTALASLLKSIGTSEFPLHQSSEWVQPLNPSTEYDDDTVGATGWAVHPRVVDGDFPFSHPFQNSINGNTFDFEFSMALDRPTSNPTQFDFLLTAGNKAPSNASSTDERAQDEAVANTFGIAHPLGMLGIEMDSANIPRGFINAIQTGNRMAVFGRWIVDTGHALATQSGAKVPRTEFHPPLLMACASNPDPATTRVLFTSRAFLVGETFTTDQKTIYDDASGNDGTFLVHLAKEIAKVNANIFGIPTESLLVEAHPKIKSNPFRGLHLMHFQIRPPAPKPSLLGQVLPHHLQISYNFTTRTSCAVQVVSSAADTIDVYVVMNSASYKQFPLPKNNGKRWSRSELAALNSSSGTDYLLGEILSAAFQELLNPVGGPIAAGVVDGILSRGVQSDAYESQNDAVDINSTVGAVMNIPATNITANAGVHHNDDQPYPVYGWLEAKWVQNVVVAHQTAVSATTVVPHPM